MTGNSDHYVTLDIRPQATADEVAKAYRIKMRANHPDTRELPDSNNTAASGTAPDVQGIMDAYAVLKDPARRSAYDRQRQALTSESEPRPDRHHPARFPPAAPPLTVGPVRWHQFRDATRALDTGPDHRTPFPAWTSPRRLPPLVALFLPTQVLPSTTDTEPARRKNP
jgi:curved DNA-binding protein CbpA